MQKIITKWWWLISLLMLASVFVFGYLKMFFHQDDLDWFILANRPLLAVMKAPIGDHINYVWRLLLSAEWNAFHLNFPPYLAVSLLIHASVVWVLYVLTKRSTGRKDLAASAAVLFTINTNWTETLLWISGQTITITGLFVLLSMLSIWRKKGEGILLLLSSWTSALALGLPTAMFLVYKRKRWLAIFVLVVVGVIYKTLATDSTRLVFSWEWVGRVGIVWGLMIINSVVGRLIMPFDRLEIVRIVMVSGLMVYGLWQGRTKLGQLWRDTWCRFLVIQIAAYYLIVAVGRAQYGIGIMRAERYAYLGLALVLLLVARVLRNRKMGRWIWVIPMILVIQTIGFYKRAEGYILRPSQLKNLFENIYDGKDQSERGNYLPHFVLNDERLKYGDVYDLMKR